MSVSKFGGAYNKALIALVGAAVIAVGVATGVDSTTYQVVVAALTALGVYGVPNA